MSSCYTLGSQHLLNVWSPYLLNVYLLYHIWHAYFLFFFLLNSGLFFYLPNWNLLLGIDLFKFLGIWLPPHSDVHMKKKYERLSLLVLFIIHILNEDRECLSLSKCLFFSFMDLSTTCFHKYTMLGYIKQLLFYAIEFQPLFWVWFHPVASGGNNLRWVNKSWRHTS